MAAPRSTAHRVSWKDRSGRIRVRDARVHLAGEFGGNLDVDLESDVPARELLRLLELRVPAEAEPLGALGWREMRDGVEAGFWSERVIRAGVIPEGVELVFAGKTLETLSFRLIEADPEDVPQVRPLDTASTLAGRMPEFGSLRTERGLEGFTRALCYGGWGGALLSGGAALARTGIEASPLLFVAILLAVVGGVSAGIMLLPIPSLEIDPLQGRLVRWKGLGPFRRRAKGPDAERSLADFGQVEIREYASPSSDVSNLMWSVVLTPRDSGRLRAALDTDSVELESFSSLHSARLLAARVGAALGRPVLDGSTP